MRSANKFRDKCKFEKNVRRSIHFATFRVQFRNSWKQQRTWSNGQWRLFNSNNQFKQSETDVKKMQFGKERWKNSFFFSKKGTEFYLRSKMRKIKQLKIVIYLQIVKISRIIVKISRFMYMSGLYRVQFMWLWTREHCTKVKSICVCMRIKSAIITATTTISTSKLNDSNRKCMVEYLGMAE